MQTRRNFAFALLAVIAAVVLLAAACSPPPALVNGVLLGAGTDGGWPACRIRVTDAGPIAMLAFAGTRQKGGSEIVYIAGYCRNPGGGYRVEIRLTVEDAAQLGVILTGGQPRDLPGG